MRERDRERARARERDRERDRERERERGLKRLLTRPTMELSLQRQQQRRLHSKINRGGRKKISRWKAAESSRSEAKHFLILVCCFWQKCFTQNESEVAPRKVNGSSDVVLTKGDT